MLLYELQVKCVYIVGGFIYSDKATDNYYRTQQLPTRQIQQCGQWLRVSRVIKVQHFKSLWICCELSQFVQG